MSKKGDAKLLFGILAALLAFTMIFMLIKISGERGKELGNNFTACGSTSITAGRCVASKSDCQAIGGQFFSGLGCKGEKPYCCTGGEAAAGSGSCSWDRKNWLKCEECKVGMISAEIANKEGSSVKQGNQPYVRCTSDQIGADCFKASISGSGGTFSCTLVQDVKDKNNVAYNRRSDAYEDFICDAPAALGSYTAKCEIDTTSCCAAKGAETATAAFNIVKP